MRLRVALATDSPEPSGVGRHMIDLAGALGGLRGGVEPVLAFSCHPPGRGFAARARAGGLAAEAVEDWRGWLARERPDVVHIHAGIAWEGHDLVRLGAEAGLPVVRTEHLPWLIDNPWHRDAYARMVGDVEAVVAVSRAAAETWRAGLRGMPGPRRPLACVPNGVAGPLAAEPVGRASARHPTPKGGGLKPALRGTDAAPVILCVARFTPQKGHDALIDAFAEVRRAVPGARLLLAGTGPEERMLRARARGHETGGVEFLGNRDDVPNLMARATVMALPSRFEGLSLAVLEAMAVGLPVVASRIGGVTEALGDDHPWLVPPGDAGALAAALLAALADPGARVRVAAQQRARWAASHTLERMAADTAQIYRSVAGRTRGRDPMRRTRLGFIGAGGVAHRHLGVLGSMPDVQVVAVADPDAARAREAAERTGAMPYADHEAMLAAEDLDAAFVCVPPFAHGAPERACIRQGLPFFVEKPLSLDLALAEAIAAEVEAAGLLTAVGYHWRYLDVVDEARRLLRDNPAHLMQGFWISETPPPRWWWREDAGGGQVVEQATHIIDLARFLAGDVEEVFGLAARRERGDFEGLDVPTASAATLRFASGAIANLSATCLLRWNHRVGLHVFADALAIEISDHEIMVDTGRGRPVRGAEGDPVWREDRDFVEAVQGAPSQIRAPYAEALMTHRVALAVARSAKSGEVVRMEGLRLNPQPPFRRPAPARAGVS